MSADGARSLAAQMRAIANAKFTSSWHAGPNAMIPEPKEMTVDVDTRGGLRRFFAVDTEAQTAKYVAAFEKRYVKPPPPITPALAEEAFDKLWQAFDRDYAMFTLRPEVDWTALRNQYRPKALASKSTPEFAAVCADLLRPLRDLHVWLTMAGANVPVFNRPRSANSNPSPPFSGTLARRAAPSNGPSRPTRSASLPFTTGAIPIFRRGATSCSNKCTRRAA